MKLFSISSFSNGDFATVIIGMGEFGIIAVLPLWLQFTLGYTALEAGGTRVAIAVGIAVLTTVFFSTLTHTLHHGLVDKALPAGEATQFSDEVTTSDGAAIHALAQNPATAAVADAAREAKTHALALDSFLASGFLIIGVVATLFIPNTRHSGAAQSEEDREGESAPTN